jgi:predicted branched-subunit amino acid permease
LFILPFGWPVFLRLVELPGNYVDFARIVWQDSREVFWFSLGFAKFFGPGGTAILHKLLIGLTFVLPLLFVGSCFYLSRKKKLSNIPLATLKLSVVIFYNFIDVPYLYLFYTSSFISLLIVAYFISSEAEALPASSI